MQMVQGLNDEASRASQESTSQNNENNEEKKKQTHWSGVQVQGFQTHTHIQPHQDNNVTKKPKCNEVTNKEIEAIQPEPQCETFIATKCRSNCIVGHRVKVQFNKQ